MGVMSTYLGSDTSKYLLPGIILDRHENIFRDIDAPAVRRIFAVEIVMFLQRHLPSAREKPVDKNLRRVWIGRPFDQTHRPAAGSQLNSFFPVDVVELVDRQSLALSPRRIPAADAERVFSLR